MEDYNRKRPAPTLTRENHEEWFTLLKLYFQIEGIWSLIIGVSLGEASKTEREDIKARYTLFTCTGELNKERIRE